MLGKLMDGMTNRVDRVAIPSLLVNRLINTVGEMILPRKVADACGSVFCGYYCLSSTGCYIQTGGAQSYERNVAYASSSEDCSLGRGLCFYSDDTPGRECCTSGGFQ